MTRINGNRYIAETEQLQNKAEITIQFKGFLRIPTGVWINKDKIEYVAGDIPRIYGVPERAVLKSWDKGQDILVYQDGSRILWLLGTEIDPDTEVICHIYSDQQTQLPQERVLYGFDNRGFNVSKNKQMSNELQKIGNYRVFEREIPSGYNVTAIVVGLSEDGKLTWSDSFRIDCSENFA